MHINIGALTVDYRIKSFIQISVDCLPDSISHEVYYYFQRRFGGLKNIEPLSIICAGNKIAALAAKSSFSMHEKKVLEVGTGRSPILPLSLWLHGAS